MQEPTIVQSQVPVDTNTLELGSYTLIRNLGEGTYGQVGLYEAPEGDLVAIKYIKPRRSGEGLEATALREIQALKILEVVPNVVRASEIRVTLDEKGVTDTLIIMPAYKGTLRDFIKTVTTGVRLEQLSAVTRQLVTGLHYSLDLGVMHRDIKTDNILVDYDYDTKREELIEEEETGEIIACYLADFGLSTWLPCDSELNRELSTSVYTQSYKPPEAYVTTHYSAKADVWALGVTLLNYVAGKTISIQRLFPPELLELFGKTRVTDNGDILTELEVTGSVSVASLLPRGVALENSFKLILEGMLMYNPNERLSVADIVDALTLNVIDDYSIPLSVERHDWTEGESVHRVYYRTISYLIELSERVDQNIAILILTLDIFDRYLGAVKVSGVKIAIVGIACYWLAHKLASRYGLDCSELLRDLNSEFYTPQAVKESELLILARLEYRLESCDYEGWIEYLKQFDYEAIRKIYGSLEIENRPMASLTYPELIVFAKGVIGAEVVAAED